MKTLGTLLALIFCAAPLLAQHHPHAGPSPIRYPDIPGYMTLKADLHQHTVFSDGNVWPTIRIQEALRDSLDVISLTEHLEYQPHEADIPHPDRNRSYEIATAEVAAWKAEMREARTQAETEAREHDLLVVHGSEITRSEPIGHSNALFISDANKLLHEKAEDAFKAAKEQGAFVFWNHPAWHWQSPTGNPVLSDFQKERIKNGELHGIEVINFTEYGKESLALALEQGLTIMGTSDIHGLIDWDYTEKGTHRPVTLVFAKNRTLDGVKEALFAGRTVAAYDDIFVGRAEFLKPLLEACIEIRSGRYIEKTQVMEVVLKNRSSSTLLFENAMPYSFYSKAPVFEVPAGGETTLQIKTLEPLEALTLQLKPLKAYSAPEEHPILSWQVSLTD